VISIIAVLAGLSMAGITSAMLAAKKVQVRNDMSQIALGITSYYTEYGRYPVASTATTDQLTIYGFSTSGNDQIINVLRCTTVWATTDSASPSPQNPRQIQFLQPKVLTSGSSTAPTKGCVNGNSGKWYDPWGTQYVIFIDGDYAGDISAGSVFSGMTPNPSFGVGVASVGYWWTNPKTNTAKAAQPDAMSLARPFEKTTDLLSWQ